MLNPKFQNQKVKFFSRFFNKCNLHLLGWCGGPGLHAERQGDDIIYRFIKIVVSFLCNVEGPMATKRAGGWEARPEDLAAGEGGGYLHKTRG